MSNKNETQTRNDNMDSSYLKSFIMAIPDSVKEFKNPRSIVIAALLLALHTVLALFVSIQVTNSLRISISFLTNCITGYLFGPIMGLVCGGLGDIIQFIIKPTGPYFPGWTINAALAGFIYGLFLYKKSPKTIPAFSAKPKNKDKNKEKDKKKINIYDYASVLIMLIQLGVLLFTEIIKYKDTTFSGISFAKNVVSGSLNVTILIDFILLLVGILFIIVAVILNWYPISIVVSLITVFVSWLAIYTDKKTTSVGYGFIILLVLTLIYAMIHIFGMMRRRSIDIKFMLLIIFTMTLDTFLVNVFLGTYWVSMMYGKGFSIYFTARLVKNVLQLPVNIILVYYMLGFMKNVRKHLNL